MKDKLPVNIHQFKVILKSLNSRISDVLITKVFRECFEVKELGVVCYDSFLVAAERTQLFSDILRLPFYCGNVLKDSLTPQETSALGSIVEKHFVLFNDFLTDNRVELQPVSTHAYIVCFME
jgi:hypothetical protein